jgi:hypothetical protein
VADKKVNQPEAHALVAWLKDNLRSDPSLRDASVGIISLGGAEQARVLCKLVLDQFTDIEIARHKIVTGDPSLWQVLRARTAPSTVLRTTRTAHDPHSARQARASRTDESSSPGGDLTVTCS